MIGVLGHWPVRLSAISAVMLFTAVTAISSPCDTTDVAASATSNPDTTTAAAGPAHSNYRHVVSGTADTDDFNKIDPRVRVSGAAAAAGQASSAAAAIHDGSVPAFAAPASAQDAAITDPAAKYTVAESTPGYAHLPRQVMPWAPPLGPRLGNCGSDKKDMRPCNVTALAAACNATPGCTSFNTDGFLHACPGGRCGCDASAATCIRGKDIYSRDPAVNFGSSRVDMYVRKGATPLPSEWRREVDRGSALYASPEPSICYLPEVGNGMLATVPGTNALFVSGLFNGHCGNVHKARLPSPLAVGIVPGPGLLYSSASVAAGMLNLTSAVYTRRWVLAPQNFSASAAGGGDTGYVVEQRIYAHRSRRNLLVAEYRVVNAGGGDSGGSDDKRVGGRRSPSPSPSGSGTISLQLSSLFNPPHDEAAGPGNGCAGSFHVDMSFNNGTAVPSAAVPPPGAAPPLVKAPLGVTLYNGRTLSPGDAGQFFNVSIVADNANGTVRLATDGTVVRFLSTVVSSLDQPGNTGTADGLAALAQRLHAAASAVPTDTLYNEHIMAWSQLLDAGIDVVPNATTPEAVRRALDVATHINTSMYYLLSSVRADHHAGISPGGIASASYQGAVFMDMDLWMAPYLYLTQPELARSALEYRFLSLNASRVLATRAGYKGAMFAWTAAYQGHAFACCSMHGSLENCLEQHVTGDVAINAWQYYAATGDKQWLRDRGMPLLEAIAQFHVSRVTARRPAIKASNTSTTATTGTASFAPHAVADAATIYDINGVLPVDEWCVGSGCGCESPGVNNDAQMNAAAKLSLRFAAEAATELWADGVASAAASPDTTLVSTEIGRAGRGRQSDPSLHQISNNISKWLAVSKGIPLLFNTSAGRHEQFTSPQCPGGQGGTHYTPHHTVCPEDVLLLSYPLGEYLNVSAAVMRADADYFLPITCKENAGMTTPIHTAVLLQLGREVEAQAAFNRSLYAACYGPFNVRNEVDKHADIIGSHHDNSHFLTGDGGYLQAVMNGYGGLRILPQSLKLYMPRLPEFVAQLRFRRLRWRSTVLDMSVSTGKVRIAQHDADEINLNARPGPHHGGDERVGGGREAQGSICLTAADGSIRRIPAGESVTIPRVNRLFPAILKMCKDIA